MSTHLEQWLVPRFHQLSKTKLGLSPGKGNNNKDFFVVHQEAGSFEDHEGSQKVTSGDTSNESGGWCLGKKVSLFPSHESKGR
jgi:hypothetical protein